MPCRMGGNRGKVGGRGGRENGRWRMVGRKNRSNLEVYWDIIWEINGWKGCDQHTEPSSAQLQNFRSKHSGTIYTRQTIGWENGGPC